MQSPDHCLHTLLPPLNDIGTEDIILSCPDVYLICINDLSPLTVCLNLLICEQVFFTYVCIASCNFCIYVCYVQNKRLLTLLYLLTYLLRKNTAGSAALAEVCSLQEL